MKRALIIVGHLLTVAACRERPEQLRAALPPDIVVDSALPMDSLLRRFQSGAEQPEHLLDAAASVHALTQRYLDAIARSDTSALRAMHISKAEYGYLYFPASRMMHPPYELPPEIAWLLHSAESAKGMSGLLRRFGGLRLQLDRVHCPDEPLHEGPSVVWRGCLVRYRGEGDTARERPLFAAIIKRDGRFKVFSYATPL